MKKIIIIFIFCFFCIGIPLHSQAQIITTFAGTGTPGYSGDGGLAVAAQLNFPDGVVTDNSGNVIFSDWNYSRIRKINTSGIITTIAGTGSGYSGDGGAATDAQLWFPQGVAVDNIGNIFIADATNKRIRKIDASGTITTFAGNGTAGGTVNGVPATSTSITYPDGVATDGSGNVFIADNTYNRIHKVDPSGILHVIAGTGTPGFSGDGGPSSDAQINDPMNLATDTHGNLFFSDSKNHRIRKIDSSGIITTVAGSGPSDTSGGGFSGDGGPATLARLFYPTGIAVDAFGCLYIVDNSNHRIRKVNESGIIYTIAGNGATGYSGDGNIPTLATFSSFVRGIAVDVAGNIYIADESNNCIRKISSTLTVSKFMPKQLDIIVSPNPSVSSINYFISSEYTESALVTVTNMTGEKKLEFMSSTNVRKELQLNLPPAIYLIKTTTAHGNWSKEIVVQ